VLRPKYLVQFSWTYRVATESKIQQDARKLLAEITALQNQMKVEQSAKKQQLDKLVQEINQLQITAIKEKNPGKAKIVKAKTKVLFEAQAEHLLVRQENMRQQLMRLNQARQNTQENRLQQQLDDALAKKKQEYSQLIKDTELLHEKARQKGIALSNAPPPSVTPETQAEQDKEKVSAMQRARAEVEKLIEDVKPHISEHVAATTEKAAEAKRLMTEITRLQEAAEKGTLTESEARELEDRVARIEDRQRQNRDEINHLTQAKIKYELALSKAREERLAIQALKAQDAKLKEELNALIEEKEAEQRQLESELDLIRTHADQEAAALKAQRDAARALADKQAEDSQVIGAERSRRGLVLAVSIIGAVGIVLAIYFFTPVPDLIRQRLEEIFKPPPPPVVEKQAPRPVLEANKQSQRSAPQIEPGRALSVFRDRLRSGGMAPSMVRLSNTAFLMGTHDGDSNEQPQTLVRLNSFAISTYPIRFDEYATFVRNSTTQRMPNDQQWGGNDRPVINISWNDALEYTKWLTAETGQQYRLPSEREWEYAAGANATTLYWWGDSLGSGRANCRGCGSTWDNRETSPVGSFMSNAFGLYDTVGNVMEWTLECYHENYRNAPEKSQVWEGGDCSKRVVRGSAYDTPVNQLRITRRIALSPNTRQPNLGFRVVRVD
jgi:formylglycine-generating enzyme required for sulfatase activity